MNALIKMQIQEQMEQAVECIDGGQFTAAALHYRECAELCQALELDRQTARAEKKALQEEKKKQIALDIP